MATVVVSPLRSTNQLVAGWPAPRQPTPGANGSELLEEAIRFHDFTNAQIKKGGDFPLLDADLLARGVPNLRWGLHDAALEHLTKLTKSIRQEITKDQFEAQLLEIYPKAAKGKRKLVSEALPRAAVRALISPDFRSPERLGQLSQGRGKVLLRRLEDLDGDVDGLQSLVERQAVEQALASSFGSDVIAMWGGSRSLAIGGRANDQSQAGGYASAGRTDVGLTEKLYEQFSAEPFKKAHSHRTLTLREVPSSVAGGPAFRLHVEIRQEIRRLFRETMLGEWKSVNDLPRPFGLWHRNLEALESRFLHACVQPDTAPIAAAVGLPWALVLTGVLRVYLAALTARVLMVSLPIRIGWNQHTGYLGVALWEALSGEDAPHTTRLGYLVPRLFADSELRASATSQPAAAPGTQQASPLLSALDAWQKQPFQSFLASWGQSLVHQQRLTPILASMAAEPVLIARPVPKAAVQPKQAATVEETMATWPRYPVCRYPGVSGTQRGAELRSGAHLSAQLHLFVADEILRVALDDLGLPQSSRRDEGSAVDLSTTSRRRASSRFTDAIAVNAGSMHWGGRHPPHVTHRDGSTFDMVFGARTVAWLEVKDSKAIDAVAREMGLGTKRRPYTDLEGVCHTLAQHESETAVTSIFRSLMRDMVQAEFKPIRDALSRAPSAAELLLYAHAESRLAGTPHFVSSRASQQVHIAYAAILLSCPTQVIFSSPIAHLRAMRAVRFGLAAAGRTAVRGAADALRDVMFVFKPEDHHDHWHVQYTVPGGSGADPKPSTERVSRFLPLWAELGVDLDPFEAYLNSLVLSQAADAQVRRTRDERDILLDLLRTYSPKTTGRSLLRDLFLRFSRSDPDGLLKPSNATKLSVPLQALADETQGIVFKVQTRRVVIKFLKAVSDLELVLTGDPP